MMHNIEIRCKHLLYPVIGLVLAGCSTVGFDNSRVRSLDIEAKKYCEEGRHRSAENRHDEAITAYGRSIRIDPSVEAYSGRSTSYAATGRDEDALADLNRAILLSPRYAPAYMGRGAIYFRKAQYEKAVKDYRKAIRLDPGRPDYYFNTALAHSRLGQREEARAMYEKSVSIDHDYYPALYNLACIYADADDRRKALESLEKAVAGGFSDAKRMTEEASFAPLRNNAGFRALLRKIERRK